MARLTEHPQTARRHDLESSILEQIATGASLTEVLESVVLAIEELAAPAIASIVFLDDSGTRLKQGVAPHLPEAYNQAIDGLAIGRDEGACGAAMARGEQVIVTDIQTDPLWIKYRHIAAQYGLRACWSTPVKDSHGAVLASFALYYGEPRAPSPEDHQLIERFTHLVAISIERIRNISALKQSEAALQERLKELHCLYQVLNLTADTLRPINEICSELVAILPSSLRDSEDAVACIVLDDQDWSTPDSSTPVASIKTAIHQGARQVGFIELGYLQLRPGHPVNDPFLAEEQAMLDAVGAHVSRMLDTRQLNERLTQSERLKAVGQLTGGVAHDFNNLLTVMLGNIDMLSDALVGDEQLHEMAEMVGQAAEKAALLTHRLLAFARQQALTPTITDLHRLITDMNSLLQRALGEQIKLVTVSEPGLWPALVDPSQLENAVLNLCINALDAMPEGGQLTLSLRNVVLDETVSLWNEEITPGEYVQLAVSDTGTGMEPDIAKQAFEPFFTTKDTGKGSGLGLSMVYGFARQSSGYAQIYTEPGKGTSVKLYLPRGGNAAPSINTQPVKSAVKGGNERILLVEDDDLVRQHACHLLESLGYEVVAVTNALQALTHLMTDSRFDLLFTDIVMPGGMDGRQLAVEVQKRYPSIPILFTSGYTETPMLHDGSLQPGLLLVNKPYKRQELADKVRQTLAAKTEKATRR